MQFFMLILSIAFIWHQISTFNGQNVDKLLKMENWCKNWSKFLNAMQFWVPRTNFGELLNSMFYSAMSWAISEKVWWIVASSIVDRVEHTEIHNY
jgi:hypothetical protein